MHPQEALAPPFSWLSDLFNVTLPWLHLYGPSRSFLNLVSTVYLNKYGDAIGGKYGYLEGLYKYERGGCDLDPFPTIENMENFSNQSCSPHA